MFGDLDIDDIDIFELETKTTKGLCKEAEVAETASIIAETGAIPKDKITKVYVTSFPIPHKSGTPAGSPPETKNIKERSAKNALKKVMKFHHACQFCPHPPQNKPSTMTHTHKCMNIKLMCVIHDKAHDSAEYIEKHINEVHEGQCTPEAMSMETN